MIYLIYMIYTQLYDVNQLDIVMLMHNLLEYSKSYSEASSSLLTFFRDKPSDPLTNSKSSKFQKKLTGSTPDNVITLECWNINNIKAFKVIFG